MYQVTKLINFILKHSSDKGIKLKKNITKKVSNDNNKDR